MAQHQGEHHDHVTGWRTAAALAGCSATSLRRRAQEGAVTATLINGTYQFDRSELEAMRVQRSPQPAAGAQQSAQTTAPDEIPPPNSRDGECAAEAFALFADGAGPVEAVIQLKVPPKVVASLYEQFLSLSGGELLGADVWTQIQSLFDGDITPDQLPVYLRQLMADSATFRQLVYPCCECRQGAQFVGDDLAALAERGALASHGHGACLG